MLVTVITNYLDIFWL